MTPASENDSKPVFSTEIVYESGASDKKPKWPLASVVVVAVCDGLEAVTFALPIGVFVGFSTTVPVIDPVVPARTKVP